MTDSLRSVDLLAPASGDGETTPTLPPVLAQVRQRRLRMLAMLALFAFGLGTVLTVIIPQVSVPKQALSPPMLALCGGMTAISIGLLVVLRMFDLGNRASLLVGQVFIIAAAAAMGLTEVMVVPPKHQEISGISGICLWIVMAPMLLLASPRQTLVTAVLAASWLPIFYFASPYSSTYSAGHLIEWFVPGYFCAGLATVASRSINRLGQELTQARENLREWSGYRLVHLLASGGMGQIWLARHRLLPQAAAIKFINPNRPGSDEQSHRTLSAKDTDYRQFADEARAIASLSSPHTVRIYDFGLAEDGQLFLVMEYLSGRDAEDIIQRMGQPMSQARVMYLLIQACLALEEVHAAGLVHRDIKPSNLMICRLGGQVDWVKLIDFGLTNDGHDEHDDLVSGTPGFIAPELLLGTAAPSVASDIYALAATAWFMLTGTDVFSLDGDWSTSHVSEPVPMNLHEFGIDPQLARLLYSCLAKHPSQRPATAQLIRKELQVLSQMHHWTEAEALQWWRSNPITEKIRQDGQDRESGGSITVLAR